MNESAKAHTGRRPIPESQNPDRDYPQMVSERGLIEPAPRRVRGYVDGTLGIRHDPCALRVGDRLLPTVLRPRG